MPLVPRASRTSGTRPWWPLLVLLLAGQLLVAAPLSSADAASAGATDGPHLVLTAPASPKAGLAATFTAALTDTASAPVPDTAVTLQRLDDTAWTTVATGRTDSTGHARLSAVVPAGAHSWRAVQSDPAHPTLVSDVVAATGQVLASTLSLSAPATVVDERSVTLRLAWTASDSTPVAGLVTVSRRLGSGAWTTYARVRTSAAGVASLVVTPRSDSRWRATGAAGSWWEAATSGTESIDNLPPAPPVSYPAAAPRPAYTPPQGRASGAGAHVVITTVPTSVWRTMVGRTWHRGCPVGRSGLRLLRVNYWGFDGYRYRGEMVLATAAAGRAGAALKEMYAGRYPIRRMYREDRFGWSAKLHGANDYASMGADNTSGFNCRSVVNKPGVLSPHARGRAIDLNTWENPYRSATGLVPNSWWATRSDPRMAWRSSSHPVVRIWARHGFRWTYGTGDSQHVDGRGTPVVTFGGFSG
ncbi:hypothetical protein GCM10027596_11810 [Nocardioides korecus]